MTKQFIGSLVDKLDKLGCSYNTKDKKGSLLYNFPLFSPNPDIEPKRHASLNFCYGSEYYSLIVDPIEDSINFCSTDETGVSLAYITPLLTSKKKISKGIYTEEKLLKAADKILSSVNKDIKQGNINLGIEKSSLENFFFADLYPPIDKDMIKQSVMGINNAYSLFNDFISLFNEELGKEREGILDRLIEKL
jgi:hypothetical protein